ncbi:hypothetical protein [Celeribacter neptunius]|uniref:Lipoprotein n=1 Tax=Celeribacter neptunius TaxID=588602 RepID=A0A1I3JAF0_9RHOB|nr:hypothetical protein [Celeribacter neptunius]SFI56895.1 hypothetical protein SAMN04487991_0284 [Celeribacter neptunius]
MKSMAAILPLTVLTACQMDQANEAMRGMSQDRMVVARAAFRDMGSEELAGMLLLSKDIADVCDGIEIHGQVRTFLSSRVERQPFSDPAVNRTRFETALTGFSERHGIHGQADEKAFCAAARVEMKAMTPLGATLREGRPQ